MSRDCSSLLQAHYRLDGHPHVNPIHEVLVGDKRVYLIFPRSHSDLHSYVRARKRLREHEARRLFRQMAETVAACHEQGIVLRDLKLRKFVFADPQRWVFSLCIKKTVRKGYLFIKIHIMLCAQPVTKSDTIAAEFYHCQKSKATFP